MPPPGRLDEYGGQFVRVRYHGEPHWVCWWCVGPSPTDPHTALEVRPLDEYGGVQARTVKLVVATTRKGPLNCDVRPVEVPNE